MNSCLLYTITQITHDGRVTEIYETFHQYLRVGDCWKLCQIVENIFVFNMFLILFTKIKEISWGNQSWCEILSLLIYDFWVYQGGRNFFYNFWKYEVLPDPKIIDLFLVNIEILLIWLISLHSLKVCLIASTKRKIKDELLITCLSSPPNGRWLQRYILKCQIRYYMSYLMGSRLLRVLYLNRNVDK